MNFDDFAIDNYSMLEIGFVNTYPPEERPLDDDISDWVINNSVYFYSYMRNIYEVFKHEQR